MKNLLSKIYSWLMDNVSSRIMYYRISKIKGSLYIPRWGWSKKQKDKAKKYANYLNEKIKWE